jgi:5-methylcytosine-specific restriction endonuclease McrA
MQYPAVQSALGASVLVLNRHYLAVHVINVRRAIGLLCRELAEVIHFDEGGYSNHDFESWREISQLKIAFEEPHDDWIHSINFALLVPRIIRLLSYDRIPQQTVRFNRRNIFARDHNKCQYCGHSFPTSELSLDHVVPKSRGGQTCWENIVCCCVACNVKKGGRTPTEAHMRLTKPPIKPKKSPLLAMKLGNPKYESWKTFLDNAYWTVDLK